jgi:hypothetical protein
MTRGVAVRRAESQIVKVQIIERFAVLEMKIADVEDALVRWPYHGSGGLRGRRVDRLRMGRDRAG